MQSVDDVCQLPADIPGQSLSRFLRMHRKLFVVLAILLFGLFIFILRDVAAAIPSIFRGEAVINSDELVPFFDFRTQFLDQALGKFSPLTNQYELRVRYSILTSWMRYYPVLPIALIVVPAVSCLMLTIALSYFFHQKALAYSSGSIIRYSALSSTLFVLILLYSKVTHFYTLIIGFTLFVCSALLLIEALFFCERHPWKILFLSSVLAIINPAVHYVILYLMVCCILVPLYFVCWSFPTISIFAWKARAARACIFLCFTLIFVVIPYGLYTKYFLLSQIQDLAEKVPVNYYLIRNASVPILHQLAFDISSITDNFLHGEYILKNPRFSNILYFLVLLIVVLPTTAFSSQRKTRRYVAVIFCMLIISVWCSLGYAGSEHTPTFHRSLGFIAHYFTRNSSTLFTFVLSILSEFIHVLRFPHRFQFLTFFSALCILPLSLAWLEKRAMEKLHLKQNWQQTLFSFCTIPLFFLPLLSNWDLRYAFFSGDLGGVLHPYPLVRLREVKNLLDSLPTGRTIVIPPSEASNRIVDVNGVLHKFIDKFYIYYLNKPSVYYGLDASIGNKIDFFLFYRSLQYGEYWWLTVLREKGIRYVVINKEISASSIAGVRNFMDIESTTLASLRRSGSYMRKNFENEGFVLYELVDRKETAVRPLYFDVPWDTFICYQQASPQLTSTHDVLYNPKSLDSYLVRGTIDVLATDKKKASIDLFVKSHTGALSNPSTSLDAFDANIVPSTLYSGNIMSLWSLFRPTRYNLMKILMPGIFDTLTGYFVGMPGSTSTNFSVSVSTAGTYDVYLRAIPTINHLLLSEGGQTLERSLTVHDSETQYFRRGDLYNETRKPIFSSQLSSAQLEKRIWKDIVPVSYQFNYVPMGQLVLGQGKHTLTLMKLDENPFVIEGLLLMPSGQAALLEHSSVMNFLSPQEYQSLIYDD
jgi:hypothetical protein